MYIPSYHYTVFTMEKDVLKTEEIYRLLAENMQDIVSQHDTDGTILWISPSVENLLGYSPSELIHTSFYNLLQEDDRMYMLNFAHGLTLSGNYNEDLRLEYRIRKNGGGYIWFESMTKPILDEHGKVSTLQITSRDISKRKKTEKQLLISKKRQELALQGADLGLWDLNLKSGHLIVNDRWAAMLGYKVNEIANTLDGWASLVHPDDIGKLQEAFNVHINESSSTFECEHRLKTKQVKWKWILSRGKVLEWDDEGHPLRAVGTHLDITANKKMETAVMKAILDTQEEERTRFAKDLHDGIGQYLAAIRLLLNAIDTNCQKGSTSSNAKLIEIASAHIDNTIQDLRTISHNLMPGALTDLGLVPAMEEMFDKLTGATPVEIDFQCNIEEVNFANNISINCYRIAQQLLSNTLQHAKATHITVKIATNNNEFMFTYKDNGIGLSNISHELDSGTGLKNIQSRVKSLNGTINMPMGKKGFLAHIVIPLSE